MRILKPLLAILLVFCLNAGFAQNESSKNTQLADTCVPATVDDYNRLIKYFMAEKEETKQLFKFDLIQYALFRPNIAYERKIKNNLNAELAFLFGAYQYSGYDNHIVSSELMLFAPTADLKYYHNLKQRKEMGRNTNGFSGNFISFGMGSYFFKYSNEYYKENKNGGLINNYQRIGEINDHLPYNNTLKKENTTVWRNKKYAPNESIAFIRVGYGIQQRIGNIGYVATDFNFGVGTNYDMSRLYLMPEFSIKAGFAISSFKKN